MSMLRKMGSMSVCKIYIQMK